MTVDGIAGTPEAPHIAVIFASLRTGEHRRPARRA